MVRCQVWIVVTGPLVLILAMQAPAQEPKPPLLTAAEQKLDAEAMTLNREGLQLYQQGQPALALDKWRESLEIRQKLYPVSKYPGGHRDLAVSLNNLAAGLKATGRAEKALPFYEQGLAMTRTLYPESQYPAGHPDLVNSLNNLGATLAQWVNWKRRCRSTNGVWP